MYAAGPRPYPAYTAISTCEISGFYIGISAGNKKHYNSIWRYCPLWLSYSIIVIVIFTSKRVYCNKRGNFLQKRTYSKIFDIQFYNSSGFLDYKKHHRLFIHPVCFCPATADAVYGLAQYYNLPLLLRLRRVETTGLVCIGPPPLVFARSVSDVAIRLPFCAFGAWRLRDSFAFLPFGAEIIVATSF